MGPIIYQNLTNYTNFYNKIAAAHQKCHAFNSSHEEVEILATCFGLIFAIAWLIFKIRNRATRQYFLPTCNVDNCCKFGERAQNNSINLNGQSANYPV